jgi:PleD family two-component response regulator
MAIRSAQILVVDDNSANLKLLSNILTAQGYKVRPAPDGQLALRSVAVEQPDLILLDIKMPWMDGYEVCRRLKADEKHREIPVIFISALDDTADKLKGFEAGGVDYITKPFEPAEVLARVQTHIRLRLLQLDMEALVEQRTEKLSRTNSDLLTEIAEHARTEEELRRANRSLTMLSACNQALIHARDETYLLQEICKIIASSAESVGKSLIISPRT